MYPFNVFQQQKIRPKATDVFLMALRFSQTFFV